MCSYSYTHLLTTQRLAEVVSSLTLYGIPFFSVIKAGSMALLSFIFYRYSPDMCLAADDDSISVTSASFCIVVKFFRKLKVILNDFYYTYFKII